MGGPDGYTIATGGVGGFFATALGSTFWGGVAAGALGGAVGGGITGGLLGGTRGALQGAMMGAVFGGIAGGVGASSWSNFAKDVFQNTAMIGGGAYSIGTGHADMFLGGLLGGSLGYAAMNHGNLPSLWSATSERRLALAKPGSGNDPNFPDATGDDPIFNDKTVQSHMQDAWHKSFLPDGSVRENGGWIYRNDQGALDVMDWPTSSSAGEYASLPSRPSGTVGSFHTHPWSGSPGMLSPSQDDYMTYAFDSGTHYIIDARATIRVTSTFGTPTRTELLPAVN